MQVGGRGRWRLGQTRWSGEKRPGLAASASSAAIMVALRTTAGSTTERFESGRRRLAVCRGAPTSRRLAGRERRQQRSSRCTGESCGMGIADRTGPLTSSREISEDQRALRRPAGRPACRAAALKNRCCWKQPTRIGRCALAQLRLRWPGQRQQDGLGHDMELAAPGGDGAVLQTPRPPGLPRSPARSPRAWKGRDHGRSSTSASRRSLTLGTGAGRRRALGLGQAVPPLPVPQPATGIAVLFRDLVDRQQRSRRCCWRVS